jgi:CubicO group peptidase (beta-lactamase class C family)
MESSPGQLFHYSGAAAQLLSAVLTHSTGKSAASYASSELFGPLGIRNYQWSKDPQGNSIGESGLSLEPRDLAKLGLLHLRDGLWDGRRLLPEGWVQRNFCRSRAPWTAKPAIATAIRIIVVGR